MSLLKRDGAGKIACDGHGYATAEVLNEDVWVIVAVVAVMMMFLMAATTNLVLNTHS